MLTQTARRRPGRPGRTSPGVVLASAALAIAAATLAWHAGASANANLAQAAQPARIAIADVQRVMNSLEEVQLRQQQYAEMLRQRDAGIAEQQRRLQTMDTRLQEENMTEEQRRNMLVEMFELNASIEARTRATQELVDFEQGQVLREFYEKILGRIESFAQREGFDLVLFDDSRLGLPRDAPRSTMQQVIRTRSVLYRDSALDVTDRIIAEMNAAFEAGAGR
ncbi:MAG: OmpH family outer membrane protein [Phycisphaerales bacterium]|nr:MAG: OmpH family outer membrane protein [Phycisphaerales bacterium]